MSDDLERLLETERGELRDSLLAAREQLPAEPRLAALAERLSRAGVVWPPDPPQSLPAETGAGASPSVSGLKLVLGAIAVGGAALVVALSLRGAGDPATDGRAVHAPGAASTSAALPVLAPSTPGAEVRGRGATARRELDGGVSAAPAPAASAVEAPVPEPSPEPALRTPGASSARDGAPAPSAVRRSLGERTGAEPGDPRGPALEAAPAETEVEILKRARNALDRAPAEALGLTDRCRAEYPRGAFAPEREFIAISALARLGRRAETATRAAAFRRSFPRSAYWQKIERLLETP